MDDNALDFELAKSVGVYFRLNEILSEVLQVVKDWKTVAKKIEIKNAEIELMSAAFRY
jgi:serine/threonine-protein kinase HipA